MIGHGKKNISSEPWLIYTSLRHFCSQTPTCSGRPARPLISPWARGRTRVFLAQRGYTVTGVDRSRAAVAMAEEYARDRGAAIHAVAADMLDWPFPENQFDVILDFYFLERALVPRIQAGLKKGGILFSRPTRLTTSVSMVRTIPIFY